MIQHTLSYQQAQKSYTHLAGALSLASHYEALATRHLLHHADFAQASAVFELGCGTGHFAAQVLAHLPPQAQYKAIDVTPKMIELSRQRLARFGERVHVELSDGAPPMHEPAQHYDRFISNFVLDLLPEADIHATLNAAYHMLQTDGLLCLASLAPAQDFFSRQVMRVWEAIYHRQPQIVGGCRPLELLSLLDNQRWMVQFSHRIAPLGVPLEVVIARKR